MPNLYQKTAGSFIEPSLSTESESPNLFIINQTGLQYTTDGSLIQSSLLARSINRNQFLINKSLSDQRPPVRLIKQNPQEMMLFEKCVMAYQGAQTAYSFSGSINPSANPVAKQRT